MRNKYERLNDTTGSGFFRIGKLEVCKVHYRKGDLPVIAYDKGACGCHLFTFLWLGFAWLSNECSFTESFYYTKFRRAIERLVKYRREVRELRAKNIKLEQDYSCLETQYEYLKWRMEQLEK